ncbi:MAG: prolipoprotein diacylglyceryl transferase [Dehalococcoidia bacterium]|nr:prolipoprotein diacylglyceryl transferase [Dehalococcoidia bacterium]
MLDPLLAITIGIDPEALALGPISVRWYGVMYVVGIAVGIMVVQRVAPRLGASVDALWDLFPMAFVAGLLGGRLYYVVQNDPASYLREPARILAFWQGGMAFFGAIIGVTIAIVAFAAVRRLEVWPLLDAVALFAAVGQPFGRIGNIINGDVIGYETSLPWGTIYEHARAFAPELGVAYHPAAAYSILANLVLLAVLSWVIRARVRSGVVFAAYLVGYSVTQFVVFFWRANTITLFGLKQAQLTAIVTGILGALVLVYLLRMRRTSPARADE